MELTLARQAGSQVLVTCDSQPSHTFDLLTLAPGEQGPPQPLDDPVAYGKAVYQALFPPETAARRGLDAMPERILLVTTDDRCDAIPWEYAYGLYGAEDVENFLVLACHFVRGLPLDQRIPPPALDSGLHIIAIPSNPLDTELPPLDIDAEWMRLKEIISEVPHNISLERTRPSTIEQVRRLVANQRNRVVHFMGHGGQYKTGAILCFEKENGELHPVTAREFVMRVRGSVFLVTLNACVSATPGSTTFSNLAAALVRQKTAYALGMRLSIHDDDACSFSRSFYSELASRVPVEEALFQARLTLANSPRSWVIGVPVLYTALTTPASGFTSVEGVPTVNEHQPQIEVISLPRAEGAFQGRTDELKQLGELLTGDNRPRLVTIHGSGGQGKTALVREAVERFAYAWPGGVWATTLENLPGREVFVSDLARFLDIATQEINDPAEIERQVLRQLNQRRTLIVLDNAETLVEAVKANDVAAIRLARFLREQLSSPLVSLLATSREFLGWDGEVGLKRDLNGLTPEEGARLFWQAAPQRVGDAELALAEELSRRVEGHPLSLRLLGGTFNDSAVALPAFVKDCEIHLLQAENKYVGTEHRHRTLYVCIDTSMRYLDAELADVFSKLWLFHAPFLPGTAVAIFDPEHDETKDKDSPVYDQFYTLWRRGLLMREEITVREGALQFYRVLPTIRPYIEKYLAQVEEREKLLEGFGEAHANLVRYLHNELDRGGVAALIAIQSREDLERGASCMTGVARGYYLLDWGWVLQRLGDTRRGLKLFEQALEIGQGQDRQLELLALSNMAAVYQATGQPQRALELYEQALPIRREVGDRAGEATTLNNMALVYDATGQPQRALELYEQALLLMREVGNRAGEATTLANMAGVLYQYLNRSQEAIITMEQAVAVMIETGLPHAAAGQTRDDMQQFLVAMHQGISPGQAIGGLPTMPSAQLQVIITNTVVVMTTMQERRAEWREVITKALQQAKSINRQHDVDFYAAVLALLDGQPPALPGDHPYATTLAKIQEGIAAGGLEVDDTPQDDDLPFDAELIPRSIAALSGGPQEKMAHVQYLTAMSTQTTDEAFKALLQLIQLGLFGSDLSQLGQSLSGVYREAWEDIVMGVEAGGVDPRLFVMIVQNTLAVLGPAVDQRNEWCAALTQMRSQAAEGGADELVVLIDAIIGLLDAGGNPAGLGTNLTGIYARTWQEIVERVAKYK
jgi:tetratricopeptide (TPR) repeat protein